MLRRENFRNHSMRCLHSFFGLAIPSFDKRNFHSFFASFSIVFFQVILLSRAFDNHEIPEIDGNEKKKIIWFLWLLFRQKKRKKPNQRRREENGEKNIVRHRRAIFLFTFAAIILLYWMHRALPIFLPLCLLLYIVECMNEKVCLVSREKKCITKKITNGKSWCFLWIGFIAIAKPHHASNLFEMALTLCHIGISWKSTK